MEAEIENRDALVGARSSNRELIEQAKRNGASLPIASEVERVIIEEGTVVDRDLRALAAESLFVCHSPVFTRSPRRPPEPTIIGPAGWLAASF